MRTALAEKLAATADPRADRDDGLVRRSFSFSLRAINQDERSVDVIVSTDSLDSHGEVVDQDWDLKRYKANPVVLWAHNMCGYFSESPEDSLPIGYAKSVAVVDGALEATIVLVNEKANPLAEKVWQGLIQKSIRAVSAGFRPHTIAREMDDDREYYRLSNNELYEISLLPLGSNPDAVAKAKAFAQLDSMMKSKATTTAKSGHTEKSRMDPKELEAKIVALETERAKSVETLNAMTKSLETEKIKTTELTAKVKSLETDLATATKATADQKDLADKAETRAKTAETAVITANVEALVGKKITPAEREEFIELATNSPDLFKRMVEKRADLPTATGTVVVPVEKSGGPREPSPENDGRGVEEFLPESAATDV